MLGWVALFQSWRFGASTRPVGPGFRLLRRWRTKRFFAMDNAFMAHSGQAAMGIAFSALFRVNASFMRQRLAYFLERLAYFFARREFPPGFQWRPPKTKDRSHGGARF
jgi:hypothetical protein